MKLIWKLLRQNMSKPQLIGFFLANLVGMIIILTACQFYLDTSSIFAKKSKDSLLSDEYFTITKKVGVLNSLTAKSGDFSTQEVENLKEQPFIKDVGPFIPSEFSVIAGINIPSLRIDFSTQMFFESVPDHFIDIPLKGWTFSPDTKIVPIVLPKNYLELYNFGFAEANSMPRLTEELIGMISLDITIIGKNGQVGQMKGRIVGFSERINTILVPENFINWANLNYGLKTEKNPSRLIIQTANAADPSLSVYFKRKGYDISSENTASSRLSFFLKLVVGIVVLIGVVICLLSFSILILSIYLLLEKNMDKLRILRLIGYSKASVCRPYEILACIPNFLTFGIALIVVFIIQGEYQIFLNKAFSLGRGSLSLCVVLVGVGLALLTSLLNVLIIRRKVK